MRQRRPPEPPHRTPGGPAAQHDGLIAAEPRRSGSLPATHGFAGKERHGVAPAGGAEEASGRTSPRVAVRRGSRRSDGRSAAAEVLAPQSTRLAAHDGRAITSPATPTSPPLRGRTNRTRGSRFDREPLVLIHTPETPSGGIKLPMRLTPRRPRQPPPEPPLRAARPAAWRARHLR